MLRNLLSAIAGIEERCVLLKLLPPPPSSLEEEEKGAQDQES